MCILLFLINNIFIFLINFGYDYILKGTYLTFHIIVNILLYL